MKKLNDVWEKIVRTPPHLVIDLVRPGDVLDRRWQVTKVKLPSKVSKYMEIPGMEMLQRTSQHTFLSYDPKKKRPLQAKIVLVQVFETVPHPIPL